MKKVLLFIFAFFTSFYFAQDFKKKLGQDLCKCVNEIKAEESNKEKMQMQFGLCMIKVSVPYKNEIKKEYGMDVEKDFGDNAKTEDFGAKMAMLMMGECGDKFLEIMDKTGAMEESSAEVSKEELMHGEVTKIEKENFVIFYLKGDNNILTKFYWISNVESNIELEKKYNELVGKKVNVTYYSADIFDHRINEYRKVNILSMLKTD